MHMLKSKKTSKQIKLLEYYFSYFYHTSIGLYIHVWSKYENAIWQGKKLYLTRNEAGQCINSINVYKKNAVTHI
jgi:hypothetical protein